MLSTPCGRYYSFRKAIDVFKNIRISADEMLSPMETHTLREHTPRSRTIADSETC